MWCWWMASRCFPRGRLRTLVDQHTGQFYPTLGAFLERLLTGRIRSAEIEAETAAQIALLLSKGVALTHIDTHKHVHIFPAVLRPVLRAARAAGIRAVRNPFEPAWSRRATPNASWLRRAEVSLLRLLEPAFRRIVAEEGFTTTDGALGVLATGTLDAATLAALLNNLPAGTWELVTHRATTTPIWRGRIRACWPRGRRNGRRLRPSIGEMKSS